MRSHVVSRKPIAERLSAPTPREVRCARERAGLTQSEAAQLISPSAARPFRTWQNYEIAAGQPGARKIPLPVWELFLLMTDQHPGMLLTARPPGSEPLRFISWRAIS